MDSIIKRLQDKIIGKTLHYCNPVSKPPFSKNPKKTVCRKNRERNILIILTRIHTRARAREYARTFLYIVFQGNVCPVDFDK